MFFLFILHSQNVENSVDRGVGNHGGGAFFARLQQGKKSRLGVGGTQDGFALISVFFSVGGEEYHGYRHGGDLGGNDGDPYAVQLPYKGKDQYRGALEYQCPKEGNSGGYQAVIEGGKEGGAVYCHPRKEEGEGVDIEAAHRHIHQPSVIADKEEG